jgi:hypothetical protein
VTLVVLVALGGAGVAFALTHGGSPSASTPPTATATAAASATPAVPSGFKLYTVSNGTYSLIVPESWDTSGSGAETTIESVATGAFVEIEYLNGVPLNGQQDQTADGFFNSVASAASGSVSNRTGPTSVSLAGETWYQYEADVSIASQSEHVVLLVGSHDNSSALIAYLAPSDSFSDLDSQYFQPMLQSFTFLK